MKRCLIYGVDLFFRELEDYADIIACYEEQQQFKVVGFVSANAGVEVWGKYQALSHAEITKGDFDLLIVIVAKPFFAVCKASLVRMGIAKEIILPCIALTCAKFDVDKYLSILRNPPSIFVNNCWGGLTYNSLGLQFASPMINMFESAEDYLKLVSDLPYYLQQPVELVRYEWEQNLKRDYPIGRIGDVMIHFNHYESFEEACDKWEQRKLRINKSNMLVVFSTTEKSEAETFGRLPYKNKICFVPFESDIPGSVYVEIPKEDAGAEFWAIVNRMGAGLYEYYDVLELLANGRFVRL